MTDKLTQTGSQASQELSRSLCQEQIIIDGIILNDVKKLLFTGQRNSITTSTFEKIIDFLEEKTQECEELKKQLKNEKEATKSEIEIYNYACNQLREENEELYLERNALNTANSGLNSVLNLKELECDRYLKALEEIEEYINSQGIENKWNMRILEIISKNRGENNEG